MFIFSCKSKAVTFIINTILPVGLHPDKAVVVDLTPPSFAPILRSTRMLRRRGSYVPADKASCQNDFLFCCNSLHPFHCFTFHSFRQCFRFHAEAGAEHFRQYNNFCFFFYAVYLLFQHLQIGDLIFPVEICLDGGDG